MIERTLRQRLLRRVYSLLRPNRLSGSQDVLSVIRMVLIDSVNIKSSLQHISWEPTTARTLPTRSTPEEALGKTSLLSAPCGAEHGRGSPIVWPQREPLGLDDDLGVGTEQQGPGHMEKVGPALAQQVHLPGLRLDTPLPPFTPTLRAHGHTCKLLLESFRTQQKQHNWD